MKLEVVELTREHDEEVSSFLDTLSKESGSVLAYHYPFYRDVLKDMGIGAPMYLGARRAGELCGYLPAFVKRSGENAVVSSLPFFGPNAGVLCRHTDRGEIHQSLLQEFIAIAQREKALSCSVYTPFLFDEFSLYDSNFSDAVAAEKFTQYLDLQTAVWTKTTERALIRANRAGLHVSCDLTPQYLDTFYEIYEKNCEDYDIPLKSRACIEALADDSVRGKFTQFYLAFKDGQLIAGLLAMFSPVTASYYVPCSLAEYRTYQPGTLLVDFAAREARDRGLRYWNWESSPGRDSGVYEFKKRWGSTEQSYRIYIKACQSEEKMRSLGRTRIVEEFPNYFVWPFDRL
jgi:Acetyltransferase (GNAT) domain